MSGSATFTIVMSSSSMKVARQTATSVHHFAAMALRVPCSEGAMRAGAQEVGGAGRPGG